MNDIEVGEYVRTENGFIYKIEDGEEFYEDSVDVWIGVIPGVDGIWVDKEHFSYVDKREIVKHSFNLIDLIEVGDICILEDEFCEFNCVYIYDETFISAIREDVKLGRKLISILTKEQYEANCYKVGE